jgi:hypothetical protein
MNNIETNELMPLNDEFKAELPAASKRPIVAKAAASKSSVAASPAQARSNVRASALWHQPRYRHWGINE